MSDIICMSSGGLVVVAGDSIAQLSDRYSVTSGGAVIDYLFSSFGGATSAVHGVTLPSLFYAGYSHTYSAGTFTPTGVQVPSPPAPPPPAS